MVNFSLLLELFSILRMHIISNWLYHLKTILNSYHKRHQVWLTSANVSPSLNVSRCVPHPVWSLTSTYPGSFVEERQLWLKIGTINTLNCPTLLQFWESPATVLGRQSACEVEIPLPPQHTGTSLKTECYFSEYIYYSRSLVIIVMKTFSRHFTKSFKLLVLAFFFLRSDTLLIYEIFTEFTKSKRMSNKISYT